jgi:hypothetical protein
MRLDLGQIYDMSTGSISMTRVTVSVEHSTSLSTSPSVQVVVKPSPAMFKSAPGVEGLQDPESQA